MLELLEGDLTGLCDGGKEGVAVAIGANASEFSEIAVGQFGEGICEELRVTLIAAATNGVAEIRESDGGWILIFLEIEGGDVARGADGFVVDCIQ